MKKLAIVSFIVLLLILAAFFILDCFGLAFRLWAGMLLFFITIILLFALTLSLLYLTIKQIKKNAVGIKKVLFPSLGIIGTILSALSIAYAGIYALIIMSAPSLEIGVITENGKKYVVQKEAQDIGNGPYEEIKYDYVNFIVRRKEGIYPIGG